MSFTPQHNPITDRIDKLTNHWMEFITQKEKRVCRWLVEKDEVDMIYAFMQVEGAQEAKTDDHFILFQTPFLSKDTYSAALINNLEDEWKAYQQYFNGDEIPPEWSTFFIQEDLKTPKSFLSNFEAYYRQLPDPTGLFVAVLVPSANEDRTAWLQWLKELLDFDLPKFMRIATIEIQEAPILEELLSSHRDLIATIKPDLDMPSAMEQIASAGDPSDPGVKFRLLFQKASRAASQGKLDEMERIGQAAVALANREGWWNLEVAVYILMVVGYTGEKLYEKAIQLYQQAEQIATPHQESGDSSATAILVQVYLGWGSVYLSQNDYDKAALTFEKGVKPAQESENFLGELETARLAGFCYEQLEELEAAWNFNISALKAGEQLDEELRQNTTLPYVGDALIRIAPLTNRGKEANKINDRMKVICGAHWKKKVERA